jgi:hypothetical protein
VRRGHDLTEVRILDLLIWSARTLIEGLASSSRKPLD